MVKRIMPDFTLGQKLYPPEEIRRGVQGLDKVLEVYPDARRPRPGWPN
jgi:hypothetical protein